MFGINNKTLCEYCFRETDREPCPHCGFSREKYVKDSMVLAVGSVLENRYVVGGVIGKGGFGITYLAYDRKLERRVAIKEYYPYGLAMRSPGSTFISTVGSESVEMFKDGADKFYDEARLVAKFNDNPNIVSIYDFFYGNDTVYFTMSFLKGQTLKSYIREHGVLTAGQTVKVAKDITNALRAAHHLNVLHRDISPDNIMVCSDGTIKLLDFGAARQVLTEGSQSLSVILKQGFAPIEQYQKKGKQGPWTDIYALGATLYYALTLDLLDDPMSRLEDDSAYSSNMHGIDESLWAIIHKATMLRASERYRDIGAFKEALEALDICPERLSVSVDSVEQVKFEPLADTSLGLSGKENGMAETVGYADEGGVTMLVSGFAGVTQALKENAGVTQALKEDAGVTRALKEDTGVAMPVQDPVGVVQALTPEQQTAPKKKINRKAIAGISAAVLIAVIVIVFVIQKTYKNDNAEIADVSEKNVASSSDVNDTDSDNIDIEETDNSGNTDTIEETIESSSDFAGTDISFEHPKEPEPDIPEDNIDLREEWKLEYILPDSNSRYLTYNDLEGLTAEECRLARNELFARYGRQFRDEELQDYFNSKSWYHGTIDPDNFDETVFNEYEFANRDLIIQYEKDMGFR